MAAQPPIIDDDNEPDDSLFVDPNTTLDIFIGPDKSITELADTIDSMDGVQAETIDITNEKDGTHVELISLEEPSPDQPNVNVVDNFVTVEGIGPDVAALLIAGGIRTFQQLANTPVDRIRAILEAGGQRFRIHNAAKWPEQAGKIQQQRQYRITNIE
ncbi:MAG TPA: hypothetical protein VGB67_12320 [Fibrella sp.]